MAEKTKTVEELQAENDALQAKLAKAEKSNNALKDQRKDLQEQLKVKEATKGSKLPTVKIDGDHFVFVLPVFRYKKQRVTADEASGNEQLCRELRDKKSGVLKLIEVK